MESGGTDPVVSTADGRVRADHIVLATNAYSRDLAIAPKRLAAAVWVTMIETEQVREDRLRATGWTSRSGIATQHQVLESYRLTGATRSSPGCGSCKRPRPSSARGSRTRPSSARSRVASGPDSPSWLPVAGGAAPAGL